MSSTGTATALATLLTFNFVKSFSSLIKEPPDLVASPSIAILPLEYALPAKPKLLFILIELTGKRPTYCYADESADVDRLYSMSISLLSKKRTAL